VTGRGAVGAAMTAREIQSGRCCRATDAERQDVRLLLAWTIAKDRREESGRVKRDSVNQASGLGSGLKHSRGSGGTALINQESGGARARLAGAVAECWLRPRRSLIGKRRLAIGRAGESLDQGS